MSDVALKHSLCMAVFDTKGIYDVLMDYDFIGENGTDGVCVAQSQVV